ncbi:cell division protein FtsL [Marivita sp. S2033]|uniref:cell division protein FtsL n=1 Tax=Marivita sp. S2033 TaxID=3373187 RepID=UPI0039822A50
MRSFLYIVTFLAVIAAAFWAYHENYKTQAALGEAQQVRGQIAEARARLAVLRAEWAYLNRPDRLRDLADVNFDRLGLMPLQPDQFGRVDQIAYPMPPQLPITDPVDVTSAGANP